MASRAGGNLMDRLPWLTSLTSRRLNRRSTGILGAALVAVLALPDESSGRRKRRKKARGETGEASQTSQDAEGGTDERLWCGGITGKPCPDGYECVDDPGDDCDPEAGGADCGGICVR